METLLSQVLGQDVTQMAAEEKRLLLARLLGRLAHEIRNPLSSLHLHIQLLEEDLEALAQPARESAAGRLEIIHGELYRLENIVKQFLRLAGPSALEREEISLAEPVQHVCELLRPEAVARQIQLELERAEPLPRLSADAGQLTQALVNLVVNAIQAVQHSGRIVMRLKQNAPSQLAIEVEDSGPGVPADQQTAIFEPYFTTKADGHGLGLWIAQQIAVAHGGDLQVANVAGGGARFTLNLPLEPPEAARG
jgi:signal transduction histidine kinase